MEEEESEVIEWAPPWPGLLQIEKLISWINVVDVPKNGGIIKRILEKGSKDVKPCMLYVVLVRYHVELYDGIVVAKTPDEGIEFCLKDGSLCPLPLIVVTMRPGEKAKLIVQHQCMCECHL